jgi:hypothetical protein
MPTTFNGSIRSILNMPGSANPTRGSIDLDDYSGGFGTWSGTSFAAPALAGDIAAQLLTRSRGIDDEHSESRDADEDVQPEQDVIIGGAKAAVAAALKGAR